MKQKQKLINTITLCTLLLVPLISGCNMFNTDNSERTLTIKENRVEQMEYMYNNYEQIWNAEEQITQQNSGTYCDWCDDTLGVSYTGNYESIGDTHIKKCGLCGKIMSEEQPHNFEYDDKHYYYLFSGHQFSGYYTVKPFSRGGYKTYWRRCENCGTEEIVVSNIPLGILEHEAQKVEAKP